MARKINRKAGFFSISAIAKMFSVHQQTIRLYEKQGLINPKRSEGNTRLFSDEDIDRLEEIIYLTHELGINLAGVEVIFKLKKQIKKMQNEMNKLFERTQQDLDEQSEQTKRQVQATAKRLITIKKEKEPEFQSLPTPNNDESEIDEENWQVEYED